MKSRDESRLSRLTACATSASRLRQSRAVPQVAGKLLITIFVSLGGAMIIAKRNRQDRGPFTPADEKPRRISAQQANSLRHVGIPFAAKPRCATSGWQVIDNMWHRLQPVKQAGGVYAFFSSLLNASRVRWNTAR